MPFKARQNLHAQLRYFHNFAIESFSLLRNKGKSYEKKLFSLKLKEEKTYLISHEIDFVLDKRLPSGAEQVAGGIRRAN